MVYVFLNVNTVYELTILSKHNSLYYTHYTEVKQIKKYQKKILDYKNKNFGGQRNTENCLCGFHKQIKHYY